MQLLQMNYLELGLNITCDFELDMCENKGFSTQNTAAYQLKWTRNKGVTPSIDTGPDSDHTTGKHP